MYIDNQLKMFRIQWNEITLHVYERVSRSKWKIKLSYACGAEMFLENQPDDMIQCLVLGAFNSRKEIQTNQRTISADEFRDGPPPGTWRELQDIVLE
jgi:hypothetical protein